MMSYEIGVLGANACLLNGAFVKFGAQNEKN